MKMIYAFLLASVVILAGCGGDRQAVPREICVKKCIDRRVSNLVKVDHQQPSVDALQWVEEGCRRHYEAMPCVWEEGFGIVYAKDAGDIPAWKPPESSDG